MAELKRAPGNTQPIEIQLTKADGTAYGDITGMTFAGKMVPIRGGGIGPIDLPAARFAITDAANSKYKITPAAGDTSTITERAVHKIKIEHTLGANILTLEFPTKYTVEPITQA